jgi:hypothetical protein
LTVVSWFGICIATRYLDFTDIVSTSCKQYEDGPINMEDYIPLMGYPSFEKFSTYSDADGWESEPLQSGWSRSNNTLTHSTVELCWCLGPLPVMEQLLAACHGLTVFRFDIPNETRYRSAWDVASQPVVAPRALVTALQETQKSTLETLHLDFHAYYNLSDPDFQEDLAETGEGPDDYIYPSFRAFKCLSHMTIEFEKLVKLADLPASLKLLVLQGCRFETDLDAPYLEDLVRMKEMWCPLIESVDIRGYDPLDDGTRKVLELARSLNIHAALDTSRSPHAQAGPYTPCLSLRGGYHEHYRIWIWNTNS